MSLKEEIDKWLKETGIDKLQPYDTGELDWAMNIGSELATLEVQKVEAAMLILANYKLTVAHMMGMCFARVKYFESIGDRGQLSSQRAKLNIIKPWHDAIDSKIAVVKKVHDRKVREAINVAGGRR
jgi:hypothetical protein